MALLNPPEYVPQVARFIYRYLLSVEGRRCSRDQLTRAVAPPGLEKSSTGGTPEFDKTLRLCVDLGLVMEEKGGIELSRELPEDARSPRVGDRTFRRTMADCVFAPSQYVEGTQTGTTDFVDAVSWFLTLDPLAPLAGWEAVQSIQSRSFASREDRPIKNDARWQTFRRWALFLGFASAVPGPNSDCLVPDPTDAIDWRLDELTERATEWSAIDFVESLSVMVPVLDRGSFNVRFRDRHGFDPLSESEVSPSLALALERLESRGRLRIENRADTEKLRRRRGDRDSEQFSDVTIVKQNRIHYG